MARGGVSSTRSHRFYRALVSALASAFLEWLLMFMLFVNAIFSYLITQFARYCELPIPCLICSRLDHVLRREGVGFYGDLICGSHKVEISSLVLCRFHDKLVDVHGMCENCLFSFAAKDKSNVETYRLLVGKFGEDEETDTDDASSHDHHHEATRSHTRTCCCCGQLWSPRKQSRSLLKSMSIESEVADLDVPLSHEFRQKDRDANATDSSTGTAFEKDIILDSSSQFMYDGLKVTSDTESEGHEADKVDSRALVLDTSYSQESIVTEPVQIKPEIETPAEDPICVIEHEVSTLDEGSGNVRTIDLVSICDNEDSKTPVCETNNTEDDLKVLSSDTEPLITRPADDLDQEIPVELDILASQQDKPTAELQIDTFEDHGGPSVESSSTIGHGLEELNWESAQIDTFEDHGGPSVQSSSAIGHGLEELNWESADVKVHHPPVPDLIDISEMHESSTTREELEADSFLLPELKTVDIVPISASFVDVSVEHSVGEGGKPEVEQAPVDEGAPVDGGGKINEAENESATADAIDTDVKTDLNDSSQQPANNLDLGDAYKLAVVNNRGRKLSGKLEQHAGKDSTKISGDLRLLWSQLSSPRGFELPLKDSLSPMMSSNLDDYWKSYDPAASVGMQILQKRMSLDRSDSKISPNGSSIESWDLSVVSEIEGESELDRLKRQVEHDRKLMSALCKELEEERNASADAANQAMAMITRLQEEKAAVQIEALQDIRMMEEQAEFDVDALEKLNDLLEQKEKEIQELEAALQVYQLKLHSQSPLEMGADPTTDASLAENLTPESSINSGGLLPAKFDSSSKEPLLEFEDERLFISRSLNKLEKKLKMFSNAGVSTDLSNGDFFEKEDRVLTVLKSHIEGSGVASDADMNEVSPPTDSLESRGRRGSLVRRAYSFRSGQGSMGKKEADVVTLGYELSSLNDRLLALEADRSFLEHAINSLGNGDEGARFIQEIASDLRELRRIGVRRQEVLP